MVDITERLRLNSTDWIFGDTATTAMKEILSLRQRVQVLESLRKENKQLQTSFDAQCVSADKLFDECAELRQRVAELEENWRLSEVASAKRQMNVIKLTAERDALKKLYESSEEYVIALKETRNRLAEERDEWRSKHDVACLTITNLQSKYECQLSATSKAMQGVVELTAEREELLKVVEHIRRCIPIGGFAQIHDGSATVADMDAAMKEMK